MSAQQAIDWCRERGVFFELDGDDLVVVGAEHLSEKAIDRLREIKSEIIETLFGRDRQQDPRIKFCEICGSIATNAIGCYPAQGIDGIWFCTEHVPPRERIEAEAIPAIVQDNAATLSEAKRGRFIELRNIVTSATTTIDLTAKQQRARVERSQLRRGQTIVNAERVNQDQANLSVDYKLLQDVADARNQLAEQECEADRYCRCGNLAQTQWRVDGKPTWFCDECF